MSTISFYELLGVAGAPIPRDAAAAIWPAHLVQGDTGLRDHPDPSEAKLLVEQLQAALTFRNVRPGSDTGRVGLTAEMLVGTAPPSLPLVLTTLPDVEFYLVPTSSEPARVMVTSGDLGVELFIEALPVEMRLPRGFLLPLEPEGGVAPPSEVQIDSFVAGQHDTLRVELKSPDETVIRVHIKVRMTEDGRFVIEPAVPLSIGPCRFLGLPCRAIHDLNLFPAPRLGVGPGEERHYGDQALEWARHPLLDEGESEFGLATVRTVDLDDTRSPLKSLREEVNPQNTNAQRFEWVLEDLAFPIGTDPVPVPSHFLIGLRRELGPGDDPAGAYNLGGLTIPLKGVSQILHFNYLVIEQLLLRSVPSPDLAATEGDQQFAFLKLALVETPTGTGNGATIDLTDEWTVLAGWRHQPGIEMFKLFGATFRLLGVRTGLSIQRLSKGEKFTDSAVLVGDIEVALASKGGPAAPVSGVCTLECETPEPKGVVIHDFGWKLGSFSLGSFWQTGGAKLKAFDVIRLEIEEFGLITEPTGAVYFGFSGSIPLPCKTDAGKPVSSADSAGSAGKVENGVGFRFYRLRGKIAGDDAAPPLLIDGIGISIRYGKLGITGFGIISEYVLDAHRYKEAGIGIEVRFPAAGVEIILGGLFFHGSVRGPVQNFKYGMVGLHVSPIPIGPITLTDVQLLFAWNMTPNLGPADAGSASAMRLFEWYKTNRTAVALPSNRNLGAGGWKPEDEAYTIAVSARVAIGSRCVTIAAFFVFLRTATGNGLLAGLEIFVLASKKPIGFAVVEIDGDRWSVLAGLSVGTANLIGRDIPLLGDVPFLTGTFYHTNKPATTAIGQFQDPSTWLAVHVGGKVFDLITLQLFAGMCMQVVDLPEGPRVFALRVSVTGGSRLFKVGGIDFYLTLELMAGVWRTESKVSGFIIFFEGGLNIDVFYVFSWGASVRVECSYLGPDPAFRRLACEAKIHTPWWLPDVTFRWTKKYGDPALEDMRVLATPVVEASAKQISVPAATALPALSPVVGTEIDPSGVYGINELSAADGTIPPALVAQITPVAIDSSLALHFGASVNDRLVFGQNTIPGVGGDSSKDVSSVYELVEFGIRRRPRTGAGSWTTLLDPAQSRLESLTGLPPEVVAQRTRQKVRMRWDADFQREGKPDSRRLLINSDTPYFFTIVNLEGDEALVQNTPGWPCCGPRSKPVWHTLDFSTVPAGTRVPRVQSFTTSRSTLQWLTALTPIAGAGQAAGGVLSVARLNTDSTPEALFARLTFVETAHTVEIRVLWKPFHLNRKLVVRAFRGLKLLEEKQFSLPQVPPGSIAFTAPDGITAMTLAFSGSTVDAPQTDFGWLEWVQFRFRSIGEVAEELLESSRCQTSGDGYASPGGRFAWLPNHEYEIAFKTRVTVKHEQSGELVRETPQRLVFHTKGLPGLNQAERVGEEFTPYVESAYPGPGRPLYRSEPVVLALSDKSDVFRMPSPPRPDDPAERLQNVDWVMVVSRVGGAGAAERLSRADSDWIVAHRGTVPPPGTTHHGPIDVRDVTTVKVRHALSLDPLWQRFETVLASPSSCQLQPALQPSRTVVHEPYDPANPAANPGLWPPSAVLRAGTQIRGGAFVERSPFEAGDETALLIIGSGAWGVAEGAIGPTTSTGNVTSLAVFGESSWLNFQLAATVTPLGAVAGVATVVSPAGADALLFVVDEGQRRLRILRRQAGVETEVVSEALPAGLQSPFTLEVQAFDDGWQASVGEVRVRAPRSLLESGRVGLAVQGGGSIRDLRVEALDVYRFEFTTSRYADLAAHIAGFSGEVHSLPDVAPPTSTVGDLVAAASLNEIMRRGGDPQLRQQKFDEWVAALGASLRSRTERLEISLGSGAGYLLLESPEPLPFTEDVSIVMTRVESNVRTDIPLALLSDANESRAFLVALDPANVPVEFASGTYEVAWTIARDRYRSAATDADSRMTQQALMTLRI